MEQSGQVMETHGMIGIRDVDAWSDRDMRWVRLDHSGDVTETYGAIGTHRPFYRRDGGTWNDRDSECRRMEQSGRMDRFGNAMGLHVVIGARNKDAFSNGAMRW